MRKGSQDQAYDESFTISHGSTVLYTSPSFTSYSVRELEMCIPHYPNDQYILVLQNSRGNTWADGAWIEVETENGNIALRTSLFKYSSDSLALSLYSPINLHSSWQYSNTASGTWKAYEFDDSTWTAVTLEPTCTTTATGVQYYRKTFTGLSNMASIEMQFNYRAGIVAYVNGVEVFRDNMPVGEVTQATLATGSYSNASLRGVIRAAGIAETQSVVAVELHFPQADAQGTIEFDGFVYYGAPISSQNPCYEVALNMTGSSTQFMNPTKPFEWNRAEYASVITDNLPATLNAEYSDRVIPMVNAFRFFSLYGASVPRKMKIESAPSSSGSYSLLMRGINLAYASGSWTQFNLYSDALMNRAFRFTAEETTDYSTRFYKIRGLVCNFKTAPIISYGESSYTFKSKYDSVLLGPSIYGLSNCQATPTLPEGLSIEPSTCVISGSAFAESAQTTYTISAQTSVGAVTGQITLSFTGCAGSLLRIVRSYSYSPDFEGFRIRNTVNDDILLEVPLDNDHLANTDWETFLCTTVDRFDVTLYASDDYWSSSSYIYIYESLPGNQEAMMLKARYDNVQSNDIVYYFRRNTIENSESWYYKMGSLPNNWFNEQMSGWEQTTKGRFPESTNQIQLYKKTFNVDNLSTVSGYILNIRYKFGCVVYLNGHEAFRNHLAAGAISTSTIATESYEELMYRTITLPGRFIPTTGASVDYLKQGTNVIAIAIISNSENKESLFDATVRLMTNNPESHIWEFTTDEDGLWGSGENVFTMDHSSTIEDTNCAENYMIVTLDNDRREWISSIQIQNEVEYPYPGVGSFSLYGRNSDEDTWELIKAVSGLQYSSVGQKKRIYTANCKPYNQFKFDNFVSSSSEECNWGIQEIKLYTENLMQDLVPFTYPATIAVFKNVEMAEVIPEHTTGFYDFTVTPALPAGLQISRDSGWISGTATDVSSPATYTVRATPIYGQEVSTTFTLSVDICWNGKSLMTVRFHTDGFANENSWKLFSGRTTTGTPLRSVGMFPVSDAVYYVDFCLEHGIYTFMGSDSYGDGWQISSGYTLTVDLGEMALDVQELPSSADSSPANVTSVFSTFFPFQVEFTEWKVYQGDSVAAGWNTASFDDATWETKKAAEIPNSASVTTYIRKSFQLTNVDDYQVLNVRMKYAGGVAVYFNGNRVARFNLIDDFEFNTESIEVHDATIFSKFHIILVTAGVQEGTNVIAFEVHRPVGTSSSEPFVFDATGVFGVETCSTVIDSYSFLNSTTLSTGTLNEIFDMDPSTGAVLYSYDGAFIEWTVENLEGSKWNSFNLLLSQIISSTAIAFDGSFFPNPTPDETIVMLSNSEQTFSDRTKPQVPVPVALAGFRFFRYRLTRSGYTGAIINSLHLAYCKASGAVCPGIDKYPAVAEGQISPSSCPDGYRGYSYRECSNGQLGEVKMEQCVQKVPENLVYSTTRYNFIIDIPATTVQPTYTNIVEHFYIDEGIILPEGLTLDETTGVISGIPSSKMSATTFTIYAENQSGVTSATISITVKKGTCLPDDVFPMTEVGVTYTYDCAMQGSYVGSRKRTCVLGATDGEWQKASGFCMSIGTIVILVIVAIIVVDLVVMVLWRMAKKKATAGSKAKVTKKKVVKKSAPVKAKV